MTKFKPIEINRPNPWPRLILAGVLVLGVVSVGYLSYRYLSSPGSARWQQYQRYLGNPEEFSDLVIKAGTRCGDAPFAFPTDGIAFGLWGQSYRPGHVHSGIDILPATEPGVTPVYAAYDGYLTRLSDWISTVIIRHPEDPLHPGDQVWTYYTHMASKDGKESFVSEAFPPGTSEVFVAAGTILGYQGNYSGDPVNPTGLHLHFSVVKDDGQGGFLNELEIKNTYDPSPYFNLSFNYSENPDNFAVCEAQVSVENWGQ